MGIGRFPRVVTGFIVAVGAVAAPLCARAVVGPAGTASRPLQFTSGGHVVGFTSEDVLVASGDHALRIAFVAGRAVEPVADGFAASGGKAAPLTRVAYPGLWTGITLAYDAPAGLLRSTYEIAPGADPAQILLRYNAPVVVEPGGALRIAVAAGEMRESAPVAWQQRAGRRIPVTVAFRRTPENQVGFAVGVYDKDLPLIIDPTLTWSTFLGGGAPDAGLGIAVDAAGNVSVAGESFGAWGVPNRAYAGGVSDAFVTKLDGNGALVWTTFLGGTGNDWASGIAADASGSLFVTGTSSAAWGAPMRAYAGGAYDAFVAKLDANGALTWNTFLGGADVDYSWSLTVDPSGNAVVAGQSDDAWGAPIRAWAGNYDGFVAKVDTNGALKWNTFLGGGVAGTDYDDCFGVAADAAGNLYVAGASDGTWGAPIRAAAGGSDAFVAKLDASGALLWNTFLGGATSDSASGIAVDASANVYVTGDSRGSWGAPIRPYAGGLYDAFVAKLDTSGALQWNTFLGGPSTDSGRGIAANAAGSVFVTGQIDRPWAGGLFAFAAILDTHGVLMSNTYLGGAGADEGRGIAVDAGDNLSVTGSSEGTWAAPIRPLAGLSDAFVTRLGAYSRPTTKNDFDGDGRSDIGCYYPPGGNWYGLDSSAGFWETTFGYDGTLPVSGDFDGDGKCDIGCYYPPSGSWYQMKSTAGFGTFQFGYAGTIPIVGDFDGDGVDDIGCYYPPGGNWYVMKSMEGFWQTQFGYAGTIPIVGDFDGDRREDFGCYYAPGGNWYVMQSAKGFKETQFGYVGTEPVVGDFDGDGRSDFGCYYAPGGNWYLMKSAEGFVETQFGFGGTIPLGGTLR